jgi:hypothetical protein
MMQSNAAECLRATIFRLVPVLRNSRASKKAGAGSADLKFLHERRVPSQGFPIERSIGITDLLVRGTGRLLLARLALQKLDVHVGSVDADEFTTAIREPR